MTRVAEITISARERHKYTPLQRMALFTDKSGGPDACWIWRGPVNPKTGYGRIKFQGKDYGAHRWAWAAVNGKIPPGRNNCICHDCRPNPDNRRCVNPNHLWLGTKADNARDMTAKGVRACGVDSGKARMTEPQILAIRASKKKHADIATEFGIHKGTVWRIRNRRSWAHLKP